MSKVETVFDEHLLKISRWEAFKLWLWHRRNYKRIVIWVRREEEE